MALQIDGAARKNAVARLFFRFFLCYAAALAVAFLMHRSDLLPQGITQVGVGESAFVLLALLAGILTVAKPFLFLLCVGKAFFDASWFFSLVASVALSTQGVLAFNAAFFYLAFSLFLFATAAARSCLFAGSVWQRDMQLLCSRQFLHFLLEAAFFAALSSMLYFIWSPLVTLFA